MSPIALPLPLYQIALGACIASVANLGVELQPDIFFLLFLPPLLFLDGWRIPKEGLFRDKGTILELALGLVVFTVLGVGLFINWMIPSMPLAVAFALAAIVSPTDPIAVSAIAKRAPIPKRLMHVLEGESLLNDASGLVCMRFAVAAALTGTFSLASAFGTFLWLAIGGIVIGTAVTWGTMKVKSWLSRMYGEDSGSQILVSLLIPFASYLLAEHFHCSGILAAVAAGITMSYAEQTGQALAATRVRRSAVWDTVHFAANGIIFVLLGEQLPQIVAGAARVVEETGHHDPAWLLIYILAINLALAALRLLWVWASLRFVLFKAARRGKTVDKPSWRLVAATSLAGVRGTITLAGVMTLPLAMDDGSPFPARDLAILLAAGVIIVSLVAASVALPRLLNNLSLPPRTLQPGRGGRRPHGSGRSGDPGHRTGAAQDGRGPRRRRPLHRCRRPHHGALPPAHRRPRQDRRRTQPRPPDRRHRAQAAPRRPQGRTRRDLSQGAQPQAVGRRRAQAGPGNRPSGSALRRVYINSNRRRRRSCCPRCPSAPCSCRPRGRSWRPAPSAGRSRRRGRRPPRRSERGCGRGAAPS